MSKSTYSCPIQFVALLLLSLSTPVISDENMKTTSSTLPPAIVKQLDYPSDSTPNYYPKNSEEFSNLLNLSNAGYAQFNYILGKIYSDYRLAESEKDYKSSLLYYERAIKLYARHADALTDLGFLYQRGLGTAKDINKAIALYETAGAAGSIRAYKNLSSIYIVGDDVPQDFSKAKIYNQYAAHMGHANSIEVLEHWDYFVEISSTQDEKEMEKIVEKYKQVELKNMQKK